MTWSLLISVIFFWVIFTCQKRQEVVTKNVSVTKLKLEKVVFVMFCNVVNLTFIFLDDLSLLISAIFFCAKFTCQKKQEVVTKNISVSKLELERVLFLMFCNFVKPDFYFPRWPKSAYICSFLLRQIYVPKKVQKVVTKNIPVTKLN